MNQEQIEQMKQMLADVRKAADEVDAIIKDAEGCASETSKKYLYAAAQKQMAQIPGCIHPLAVKRENATA